MERSVCMWVCRWGVWFCCSGSNNLMPPNTFNANGKSHACHSMACSWRRVLPKSQISCISTLQLRNTVHPKDAHKSRPPSQLNSVPPGLAAKMPSLPLDLVGALGAFWMEDILLETCGHLDVAWNPRFLLLGTILNLGIFFSLRLANKKSMAHWTLLWLPGRPLQGVWTTIFYSIQSIHSSGTEKKLCFPASLHFKTTLQNIATWFLCIEGNIQTSSDISTAFNSSLF